MEEFLGRLREVAALEIGYPVAFDFDYSDLLPFLSFSLNNAGDPFMPMTYLLNSHEFEQEVVAFFAKLARAPEDQWWGYVTNGSTEGNLYGLYLAREQQASLDTAHLRSEIDQTRPLSQVMAEKVERLRAWAQGRTVTAD